MLKRRAWEFKDTPTIGRTHGIHAEPITFGLKLANWYSEMQRNIAALRAGGRGDARGQAFRRGRDVRAPEPELRREDLRAAGTEAAAVSSQVIQRDRHAFYVATLAVIA